MEFSVDDMTENVVNTSQITQLELLVQAVQNTPGLRVCPLGKIGTDNYVPSTTGTTGMPATTGTTGTPATTGYQAAVTTGAPESVTTGKSEPSTTGSDAEATGNPDGDLTGTGSKGTASDGASIFKQLSIVATIFSAAICLMN
jgi:hypothetical protein